MSWSSNSKCCATCAYWAGERKPSGSFAQTNSPGDRGKCWENVFCAVTQGPSAMSGTNCPKYQKWAALK